MNRNGDGTDTRQQVALRPSLPVGDLRVGLAASEGTVLPVRAPKFPNATASNVVDELQRLVELGMLDVEEPDDSRRIYYVRTDSALWDVVAVAARALDLPGAGQP